MMMNAKFEMNGKNYQTDAETLEVLRSIVPSAKASGDMSAVIAVMDLGLATGRIKDVTTIHLQGVGSMPAKRVADLKPGDVVMFNYGHTSEIEKLTPRGEKQVTVFFKSDSSCVWNLTKLVAVKGTV